MTKTMDTKVNLERGKEYPIELFPSDNVVNARYAFEHRGEHVFHNEDSYIIVDVHFMVFREGIITYSPFCSKPITQSPREDFEKEGGIVEVIDRYHGVKRLK